MKIHDQLEEDFQKQVIALANLNGWKVAHFRRARTAKGWRTAVGADATGWPDLVLVRERVIFAELKTRRGKLTMPQVAWGNRLRDAGAEYYLWRPADWEAIKGVLE